MPKPKELTENQKRLLSEVVQHFQKEDQEVRERQIRTWRQLKFLWEGFSNIYYSEAGDKISQLVYRHNDVAFLWLHALFIHYTEGMVACYSYSKEDEKYGTYEAKQTKDEEELKDYLICPNCGFEREKETDEFMPAACPECEFGKGFDEFNQPEPGMQEEQRTLTVTKIVGVTKKAKSRQCLECYGGLYVKIPVYAKRQEVCP